MLKYIKFGDYVGIKVHNLIGKREIILKNEMKKLYRT